MFPFSSRRQALSFFLGWRPLIVFTIKEFLQMTAKSFENQRSAVASSKDKFLLCLFAVIALCYCVLQENIILNACCILLYAYILIFTPPSCAISSLLFWAPWAKFSFSPSISFLTIMELMLAAKIVFWLLTGRFRPVWLDFLAFFMLLAYGWLSYEKSGQITIFRMALVVLFSFYFKHILFSHSSEAQANIWRQFFLYLFISSLISSLFGYINLLTGNAMFSFKLGTFRIGPTVGIDRSCLVYCAGLIYPLYYWNGAKWLKQWIVGFFLVSLLLTVSMTALVTCSMFWGCFLWFQLGSSTNKKKAGIFMKLLFAFSTFGFFWIFGSGIPILDKMINRAKDTIYYFQIGDYSSATTDRNELLDEYNKKLESFTLREKLFGTGYTSMNSYWSLSNFSHNTMLDMYACFGIIPMAFLWFRRIWGMYFQRRLLSACFAPLFLLEVVYCITAFSVSTLAQPCWFYVILLP